jgi:xanthine dehydrogenase YagS FAD-binding subunit
MQPFTFQRVDSLAGARAALLEDPGAQMIAGGTTLLDLMKAGVERPAAVIDINALPLAAIEVTPQHVRIGALARNSDVADDRTIGREFPVLAEALAAGASGQLRNMATVGGNLLQRTRCTYFRDNVSRCNKREPGSGCDAREGVNRGHAVLGTSESCIATHPSDMAVALAALDATVIVMRADGEVRLTLDQFYRLPEETPERETALERGDLIVAVELTPAPLYRHSRYLKLRDRTSYEFALVSVAASLEIGHDGSITRSRIALGGVGTVPWRAQEAERVLDGAHAGPELFRRAADAAFADAVTTPLNAFKVELGKRAFVRVLGTLAETAS